MMITEFAFKIRSMFYILKAKKLDTRFGPRCRVGNGNVFGGKNRIGADSVLYGTELGIASYIGSGAALYNVSIGKFCSIGRRFRIVAGRHPVDKFISTHPAFFSTSKQAGFTFVKESRFQEYQYSDENHGKFVSIGNDVWIGDDVAILDGVKIADGAIIAAGSIVLANVPPYAIYAGIPARLIRNRFSESEIKALLKLAWWDKSWGWIQLKADLFNNIENLSNLNI